MPDIRNRLLEAKLDLYREALVKITKKSICKTNPNYTENDPADKFTCGYAQASYEQAKIAWNVLDKSDDFIMENLNRNDRIKRISRQLAFSAINIIEKETKKDCPADIDFLLTAFLKKALP